MVLSFRNQAVNRPNVLCSASKGSSLTNNASIYPFMLSYHQLSSQGPGKVVPKVVILGKIPVKLWSCLSQITQIISPD